jgi:hypothetical protein
MSRGWDEKMLAEVDQALGRGEPQGAVVDRVAASWGVEPRKVKRAIAEVLRRWGSRVVDADPDEQRAHLVGLVVSIYRESRAKGHGKVALACVDSMARILGLTRPDVLAVAGVLDQRGALTSPDEVRARLAELRQRQLGAATDDEGGGGDPSN